ncbi:unnamed protein product, partial [marine sediment metagenome]
MLYYVLDIQIALELGSVKIGQIIRHHELQSHGEIVYLWGDLNTLVNDLDTFTYNWGLMPDELNASSSPDEINHVSLFHVFSNSGAYRIELTVTDDQNNSSSDSTIAFIDEEPITFG